MEQTVKRRLPQRPSQNKVKMFDVQSCTTEEIEKKTRELYEKKDETFSNCQQTPENVNFFFAIFGLEPLRTT